MIPLHLLIYIVISLIVIGVLLWAVTQIPMDDAIRRIIRVVVVVAVCLWLLYMVAPGWSGVDRMVRVGRLVKR